MKTIVGIHTVLNNNVTQHAKDFEILSGNLMAKAEHTGNF